MEPDNPGMHYTLQLEPVSSVVCVSITPAMTVSSSRSKDGVIVLSSCLSTVTCFHQVGQSKDLCWRHLIMSLLSPVLFLEYSESRMKWRVNMKTTGLTNNGIPEKEVVWPHVGCDCCLERTDIEDIFGGRSDCTWSSLPGAGELVKESFCCSVMEVTLLQRKC